MLYFFIFLLCPLSSVLALSIPIFGRAQSNRGSLNSRTNHSLISRAPVYVPLAETQPIPQTYKKFRIHNSCLVPEKIGELGDAFNYGLEFIRSASVLASHFSANFDSEEATENLDPQDPRHACLQNWLKSESRSFELLFTDRRVSKGELLTWASGWANMFNLIGQTDPNDPAVDVVVTCFKDIYNDNQGANQCRGKALAATLDPKTAISHDRQPPYDFRGGELQGAHVINLCPAFFEDDERNIQIDLVNAFSQDNIRNRPDFANLGFTGATIWVHELTHLKFTFDAPGNRHRNIHDPYTQDQIMAFSQHTSPTFLGFGHTYQYAEPNALFAAASWWKDHEGLNWMSWNYKDDLAREGITPPSTPPSSPSPP